MAVILLYGFYDLDGGCGICLSSYIPICITMNRVMKTPVGRYALVRAGVFGAFITDTVCLIRENVLCMLMYTGFCKRLLTFSLCFSTI